MLEAFLSLVVLPYVVGSILYVYRFRGQTRFKNPGQFLRKGSPFTAPLNCLLFMFSRPRARGPVLDLEHYPELQPLKDHWTTVQQEASALRRQRLMEKTIEPDSDSSYDLGFHSFFRRGWTKFYIRWYGHDLESAQTHCPKTLELVKRIPSINGALFSYLPAGSRLPWHLDPLACSLRYHLGLETPNDDRCFLSVDGHDLSWRDGQALMFDETYAHHARNDAPDGRLILMCDVDRPVSFPGKIVNFFYKWIARLTLVPNMPGDSRGLVSVAFAAVTPFARRKVELKERRPLVYETLRYVLIVALIALATASVGRGLLVMSHRLGLP